MRPYPARAPGVLVLAGEPVRVYRNLHARCWSVQARVRLPRTHRHAWRVLAHAQSLTLGKATFVVYERGRQRVLATGVKNVHAYILGTLLGEGDAPALYLLEATTQIAYRPRQQPHFFDIEQPEYPIASADAVYLEPDGQVFAVGASEPLNS